MFFVAGITGHVGGATARTLLASGHAVRTLARDPAKAAAWAAQGVDVRAGDLDDAAALAAALRGTEAAYLMLPPVFTPAPDFAEARRTIASLRAALAEAAPPRLILLSSIGSEKPAGLGNITSTHLLEEALAGLPQPTAVVRAGSFLENYVPSLGPAAASGWFDCFLAPEDRPVPMIATRDIGVEVARRLQEGFSGRKIIELGSPTSPAELARAMSEVVGRKVTARAIPRSRWRDALAAMGLPPGSTWAFEEMQDSFNSGWIGFGVPGTEPVAATTTAAQVFAQAWPS